MSICSVLKNRIYLNTKNLLFYFHSKIPATIGAELVLVNGRLLKQSKLSIKIFKMLI